MKPTDIDDLSFEALVDLVAVYEQKPAGEPEKWRYLEEQYGDDLYVHALYMLTQLKFEPIQAREHWQQIQYHRDALKRTLDRDPGFKVALLDYFTNVAPEFSNVVFVEGATLLQKERAALVDDLTGLYNRRFFNYAIQREEDQSRRTAQPFSLLMVDADNFKEFNDTYGHKSGDRALIELAGRMIKNARTVDHVIRYAGDEFVLILPHADKNEALSVAERHRRSIEEHTFPTADGTDTGNLTVSIGVATYPTDAQNGFDLFQRADEALYVCKDTRNRVCAYSVDKRAYPRFPLVAEILYRTRESAREAFQQGLTRDISLGGLGCLTPEAMQIGASLEVQLRTPGSDDSFMLQARTVRLSRHPRKDLAYTMGLSFELDSSTDEQTLKKLVETQAGLPH